MDTTELKLMLLKLMSSTSMCCLLYESANVVRRVDFPGLTGPVITLRSGLAMSFNAVFSKFISLLLLKNILPVCEMVLKFCTNEDDSEQQRTPQRIVTISYLNFISDKSTKHKHHKR